MYRSFLTLLALLQGTEAGRIRHGANAATSFSVDAQDVAEASADALSEDEELWGKKKQPIESMQCAVKELLGEKVNGTWKPHQWCKDPSKLFLSDMYKRGSIFSDLKRGVLAVTVARDETNGCWMYYDWFAIGQDASQRTEQCCTKFRTRSGGKLNCTVVKQTKDPCEFRGATSVKGGCKCRSELPYKWLSSESRLETFDGTAFDAQSNVFCVDECFKSSKSSDIQATTGPSTVLPFDNREWPVVFLAVYSLGYGIVHSGLAFCNSTAILEHAPSPNCMRPGAKKGDSSAWFSDCSKWHGEIFAESNDVPKLLQRYGCREMTYDGNHKGGIWSAAPQETGCWGQGQNGDDFLTQLITRKGNPGYQTLYWLTSENKQKHSDVQLEMQQCFSSTTGQRLDFNPDTYSLLKRNCNKFSTEAMKYMNLPKFASESEKGYHSQIAFAATTEESTARKLLAPLTRKVIMSEEEAQGKLSYSCSREFFDDVRVGGAIRLRVGNCRRVGGFFGGSDAGDCPSSQDLYLKCYHMLNGTVQTSSPPPVSSTQKVNGVCRIPKGRKCFKGSRATCRPGTECREDLKEEVHLDGKTVYTKTGSSCHLIA